MDDLPLPPRIPRIHRDKRRTSELTYIAKTLPVHHKGIYLIVLSDVHYGAPSLAINAFLDTIEYIKAYPNVYAICNGDLCDVATRDSVGDVYAQKVTPQEQRDWVIRTLLPIKDKILGMCTGNHEERIYYRTGIDISKDIAQALGVTYRQEDVYLKLSIGDGNNCTQGRPYVYYVYATHGFGGARTKGAKAVKVERLSNDLHADVYCMAHDHDVAVLDNTYLLPDHRTSLNKETGEMEGKTKALEKTLVKTNAWVKWAGYPRMRGFGPTSMSTPQIILYAEGLPEVKVLK